MEHRHLAAFHKIVSVLSSFTLLFQSILPAASIPLLFANQVSAEEATQSASEPTPATTPTEQPTPSLFPTTTQTPTQEITPTPTEEVSPAPTAEVTPTATPEPTVTIAPTEQAAPAAAPTQEDVPAPTSSEPPHETSPPDQQNNAPQEAPTPTETPTPTITPEQPVQGHLDAVILNNVDAETLDLDAGNTITSATLTTDKADYAPTDTALISGTGFTPNTTYSLTVSSDDLPATSTTVQVTADETGNFLYAYQFDGTYRPNYKVEVKSGEVVIATVTFTDDAVQLEWVQCQNDTDNNEIIDSPMCTWNTGSLQSNNSIIAEGNTIPPYPPSIPGHTNYRAIFEGLVAGTYEMTIKYDFSKGGKLAFDFLTTNYGVTDANLCDNLPGGVSTSDCNTLVSAGVSAFTFPLESETVDASHGGGAISLRQGAHDATFAGFNPRTMKIYGATITGITNLARSGLDTGDSEDKVKVIFTKSSGASGDVLAMWGGHFAIGSASPVGYGLGNGAGSISGAPFHMRMDNLARTTEPVDRSVKSGGDRSVQPGALLPPGSITIIKVAVPNDPQDFAFTTTGTGLSPFTLDDDSDPTLSNIKQFVGLSAGLYTIIETTVAGWTLSPRSCASDGTGSTSSQITDGVSVSLVAGEHVTCTFTNTLQQAHLTLVKTITNDNGGTAAVTDWTLSASGPTPISGTTGSAAVTNAAVNAGTYTLSESGPTGYLGSAWSCTGGSQNGSQITLTAGQSATCTINNNDNVASLTLNKVVVNDNGGTAVESAWTLTATGPITLTGAGAAGSTDVVSGPTFATGTYTLTESAGPAGYTAGSWVCTGTGSQNGNQITLGLGQSAVCSITNNDNTPSLTLVKTVTNNNGGQATPSNWTLTATGPTSISGAGGTTSDATFDAGTYTLSESVGPGGYMAGAWSCQGGTQDGSSITVGPGQSATCTINNDDIAPQLTVIKHVENDNGGTAVAGNFTMNVTGTNVSPSSSFVGNESGTSVTLDAGGYSVDEGVVSGYTKSLGENCSGTIALGETKTCTITNDDIAPSLTLMKVVTNDNGGTANAAAWTLTATGPTGFSDVGPSVSSDATFDAGTYDLSESGPSGYTASAWVCTGGTQNDTNTVAVGLGQSASCTVTNDDQIPQLIVIKHVITDNGGDLTASDFTMNVTGTNVSDTSFAGNEAGTTVFLDAGSYSVDEDPVFGYTKTLGADCTGTIALGETKTCTITNDDQPGQIKIIKNTVGGNGTFGFTITGPTPSTPNITTTNNTGDTRFITVDAGTYSVSESGQTGWDLTNSSCDSGTPAGFTVQNGQTVICTFTNTKRGHIIIEKNAIPNSTQDFSFTNDFGNGNPATFDLDDDGSNTNTLPKSRDFEVFPGTYAISESAVSGWQQESAICSDQSPINAIDISPGETVTCTFTNKKFATITIVKNTVGGDGTFDFTLTGDGLPETTQLTTQNNSASEKFTDLDPDNTYSISETLIPEGWDLTNATCDNRDPIDRITPNAGEIITCTFTNTMRGKIIVQKQTLPDGSLESFDFTADYDVDGFSLTDDEQDESGFLIPGPYSVSENTPDGWDLTGATCSDGSDPRRIDLAAGETVTCIFTNTKNGSITIIKDTQPDSTESFDFTGFDDFTLSDGESMPFSDLSPSTYDFSESEAPGWSLTDINCQGGSDITTEGTDLSINLLPGEDVTCTFVNQRDTGKITVRKLIDADGDVTTTGDQTPAPNWQFDIDPWGEGDLTDAPAITTDQTGATTSADLNTGTYRITETIKQGYKLLNAYCGDTEEPNGTFNENNSVDGVAVYENQTTNCTFINYANTPILTLTKSNNAAGDKAPGSDVLFTLTVTATQSGVSNVIVKDLPSAGFTYRAGSWSAKKNNVPFTITEPVYASPGTWNIGNMDATDVVELQYTADIASDQQSGTYRDLAWATGTSVLASEVLANNDTGVFVGTDVAVNSGDNPNTSVNIIREEKKETTGQVLGAATELPATGGNTLWLILASVLFVFGGGSIVAGITLERSAKGRSSSGRKRRLHA